MTIAKSHVRAILIITIVVTVSACQLPRDTLQEVIDSEILPIERAVLESSSSGIEYSVWLGSSDGEVWYRHNADVVRPAASAIKTAVLVEFFSEQLDSLDQPFGALATILNSSDGAAIRHFNLEKQAAARNELRDLTARQLAEAMISKKHVETNAAYNATANVIIEYLGGPAVVSERLHRRFPQADGLKVARYMLADRQQNDDNLLTAESLATVLRYLAGDTANDDLRESARAVLLLETDEDRGVHYYKGGTLSSNPPVRIEAGWWDSQGAACIYVVIATRFSDAGGTENFDGLRSKLGELSQLVQRSGIRIRNASLTR